MRRWNNTARPGLEAYIRIRRPELHGIARDRFSQSFHGMKAFSVQTIGRDLFLPREAMLSAVYAVVVCL